MCVFNHLFGKYPFDILTPLYILWVQKVLSKIFQKGTHLSSAHNNMLFVGLWSQCAIGSCMGGTILYTENIFHEPWKMYKWKTTIFLYFRVGMYYRILWLKFLTSLLEFHLGLFLGTTSHYSFSANTICIVHPSKQPIHNKTGPIAVPWCTVLTQAWHVPLPLQGWHNAFIQTKVGKALSCYMALLRSNKLNILIKYSQLLWSGVKFFNSMWLKNL